LSLRSRHQSEPIDPLRGASITYRIAPGPHQGRNVLTWQTLPGCEEPLDQGLGDARGAATAWVAGG